VRQGLYPSYRPNDLLDRRDMKLSHKGMRISEDDWTIFLKHADAALKAFKVPKAEYDQVVAFVQSTKADIVEA
jgi:hemoglobin